MINEFLACSNYKLCCCVSIWTYFVPNIIPNRSFRTNYYFCFLIRREIRNLQFNQFFSPNGWYRPLFKLGFCESCWPQNLHQIYILIGRTSIFVKKCSGFSFRISWTEAVPWIKLPVGAQASCMKLSTMHLSTMWTWFSLNPISL